jgi:predicted sugar kinase
MVEVKNNETSSQDLNGWKLEVQNKTVFTFPAYTLDVNAKVKIHSGIGKNSKTDLYAASAILTKADDEVSLLDAAGNIISTSEESTEASDSPKDA